MPNVSNHVKYTSDNATATHLECKVCGLELERSKFSLSRIPKYAKATCASCCYETDARRAPRKKCRGCGEMLLLEAYARGKMRCKECHARETTAEYNRRKAREVKAAGYVAPGLQRKRDARPKSHVCMSCGIEKPNAEFSRPGMSRCRCCCEKEDKAAFTRRQAKEKYASRPPKTCSVCRVTKPIVEFRVAGARCKACLAELSKQKRAAKAGPRTCVECKETKPAAEFDGKKKRCNACRDKRTDASYNGWAFSQNSRNQYLKHGKVNNARTRRLAMLNDPTRFISNVPMSTAEREVGFVVDNPGFVEKCGNENKHHG